MSFGYSSGPRIGQILNFVREKQIGGESKTREEALEVVKERFGFGSN